MSFLKSAWFNVCINLLDVLIHYLDKKGVIDLETCSTEEKGSPSFSYHG